ncbi:S41 family peptidase [Aquimarina intermedia]|uniref:Peptidase S41-like protein n=1 Tax=Aquimarina intermedia TaxID=350814 RepID=A0A5S5BZT6_9FLAO|nr:S41 family peptidase [Aquimarina intermedia]TYP71712.1 peptidase S41-like protein [Aquimarina intermedia]
MKVLKFILPIITVALLFQSCFKDQDDEIQDASVTSINDFIWKGMNTFYLYKSEIPELGNSFFTSNNQYNTYLEGFATPELLFESLRAPVDEFSFLVDDYIALEQAFDGITMNNGMEFGLKLYPNSDTNVFGYVRYVLPGTDAESKGIKRGDIFNTINGTQLTVSNFRELINLDSYTIGLANFDGTTITPTGKTTTLVKIQYTENPVHIVKTIDLNGTKVGYLFYNGFTGDFDTQLNEAFAKFKADGVTELVLDLRYNGGGSVTTAIDLSSMITGQFNGEVFTTEEWNEDRQADFGSTNLFDTKIRTGAPINSLNLSKVYVLTTRSSASASELVINGLDPYISVRTIGTTTRGKFQASITLYDSENFSRQGASPNHTYAIQPLVLKSVNSVGFTDYFQGFSPDIEVTEDYSNLGTLGDPNERLLQTALNNIQGAKISYQNTYLKTVGESKMTSPTYHRMYKD